jgi:hypothetical protein
MTPTPKRRWVQLSPTILICQAVDLVVAIYAAYTILVIIHREAPTSNDPGGYISSAFKDRVLIPVLIGWAAFAVEYWLRRRRAGERRQAPL